MISTSDMSTCPRISLSLHGYAQVSHRNVGQFTDQGRKLPSKPSVLPLRCRIDPHSQPPDRQGHARNEGARPKTNPGSTLVTVSDITTDTAEKPAARYNAEGCFADATLNDPVIGAALLGPSTDTHSDLIERASASGKALPCERPVMIGLNRRVELLGPESPLQAPTKLENTVARSTTAAETGAKPTCFFLERYRSARAANGRPLRWRSVRVRPRP